MSKDIYSFKILDKESTDRCKIFAIDKETRLLKTTWFPSLGQEEQNLEHKIQTIKGSIFWKFNCIWKERTKLTRPLKGFPVPQKLPSREIAPQGQYKETEAAATQANQTLLQASRRALWQCTHGTDWTGTKRWRLEGAIGFDTTVSQTRGGKEMCGRVGDPLRSCWNTTAYSCEVDTQ